MLLKHILAHLRMKLVAVLEGSTRSWSSFGSKVFLIQRMALLLIVLACLGATWFSYQLFLVPQPATFMPDWANARWIEAADGTAPVAYFRYVTTLNALPDSGFVTVAAEQIFRLYLNGEFIGSNALDFVQGDFPRAYVYDVSSTLKLGKNVIALRVANVDRQTPGVRVNFGSVRGHTLSYTGSGAGWIATAQSAAAHPRYAISVNSWATSDFDASSWLPVRNSGNMPVSPMLLVNPLVYEQPLPQYWISAGYSSDAYFIRQVLLPFGTTETWLRLAATGTADVYINGHLLILWTGQPAVPEQNLADYLSDDGTAVEYRKGLELGVYDISPYLHPGMNTIAVHVQAPGISASHVGLDSLSAALSLDMLFSTDQGNHAWSTTASGWHVSTRYAGGWEGMNGATLSWPSAVLIGRPGAARALYLSEKATPLNVQHVPLVLWLQVVLGSLGGIVGVWLLMALGLLRRYYRSRLDALATLSLAYLPALTLEAVLVILAREPEMPRPFPYTWFWFLVIVSLVGGGYFLLWLNARLAYKQRLVGTFVIDGEVQFARAELPRHNRSQASGEVRLRDNGCPRSWRWVRVHWPLGLLVLLAIPLSCYNLSYEPFWQDELSSFYASRGILTSGLPFFPSGFLYTKAELYSYLLALWTTLFGEQPGTMRAISVGEYLLSLPLLYSVGCYFFERRTALLATAMLTFSPIALIWSRQMRMYEQAQLLTLLTCLLFYKALRERQKAYLVYLAALSLILTYLSHEETFIILPGIVVCVLMASRDKMYRLPAVLYQKRWWIAMLFCALVIGSQLWIVRTTHPPALGTDNSQRPFISFTTDNLVYYADLLFAPGVLGHGTLPWITLDSLLAATGCIWAEWSGDARARYCARFLIVSLLTLVLLFTFQADRYIYTLLPVYYMLAAYALLSMLRAMWAFARAHLILPLALPPGGAITNGRPFTPINVLATCVAALVCATVLIAPMLPLSNYNLFFSQLIGFSYHRHYPDYDAVGQYMHQHWRKGDVVIAVSPANTILYYTGHADYFFSIDRALYLIERNGHLIETASGAQALLNQGDFQAVLSAHARVWIISDGGSYESAVRKRFVFPTDLHIVFEGYGSVVYLRGDDP